MMIAVLDENASGIDMEELNFGLTRGGYHACLLWKDEDDYIHKAQHVLTEIIWSKRKTPLSKPALYFGKAQIQKFKSRTIINLVETLGTIGSENNRITSTYGINANGHNFTSTGIEMDTFHGSGMTCATFIVQLLKGAKINLFSNDFEVTEEDIVWQNETVLDAEICKFGNPAKMKNEVGTIPRFSPIAVCSGLSMDEELYPLSRSAISTREKQLATLIDNMPI